MFLDYAAWTQEESHQIALSPLATMPNRGQSCPWEHHTSFMQEKTRHQLGRGLCTEDGGR